jgi:hypothetical protein
MPAALQIMVGFVVGYAIAAVATYDGKSFINQAQIQAAPGLQFLWVSAPCSAGVAVTAAQTVPWWHYVTELLCPATAVTSLLPLPAACL